MIGIYDLNKHARFAIVQVYVLPLAKGKTIMGTDRNTHLTQNRGSLLLNLPVDRVMHVGFMAPSISSSL